MLTNARNNAWPGDACGSSTYDENFQSNFEQIVETVGNEEMNKFCGTILNFKNFKLLVDIFVKFIFFIEIFSTNGTQKRRRPYRSRRRACQIWCAWFFCLKQNVLKLKNENNGNYKLHSMNYSMNYSMNGKYNVQWIQWIIATCCHETDSYTDWNLKTVRQNCAECPNK